MRTVVDTNQVLKLLPLSGTNALGVAITEITLAPYVIAEVLLRRDPEPTLDHLRSFDIRYGLEPVEAFNRLASLSEAEVIDFEPFVKPGGWQTLS